MTQQTPAPPPAAAPQIAKPSAALNQVSARFMTNVEQQFVAQMGEGAQLTAHQRKLVQHVYLLVDAALRTQEVKRTDKWTPEKLAVASEQPRAFTWHHVDRQKLALDTVHRVNLGLDGLMPNHLAPVFYWDDRKKKYNTNLQLGYMGRDFIARQYAVEPAPIAILYHLVHASDEFEALPASAEHDSDTFRFRIPNPFDRGEIVGGFGFIRYDDPRMNRLVLVTQRDFQRAQAAAKSDVFWRDNVVEMHRKTVVHRVASQVPLDPRRIYAQSLAVVLAGGDDLGGHGGGPLPDLIDDDDGQVISLGNPSDDAGDDVVDVEANEAPPADQMPPPPTEAPFSMEPDF